MRMRYRLHLRFYADWVSHLTGSPLPITHSVETTHPHREH